MTTIIKKSLWAVSFSCLFSSRVNRQLAWRRFITQRVVLVILAGMEKHTGASLCSWVATAFIYWQPPLHIHCNCPLAASICLLLCSIQHHTPYCNYGHFQDNLGYQTLLQWCVNTYMTIKTKENKTEIEFKAYTNNDWSLGSQEKLKNGNKFNIVAKTESNLNVVFQGVGMGCYGLRLTTIPRE